MLDWFKSLLLLFILCCLVPLAGCGQKGDLYLPEDDRAAPRDTS